MAKRTNGEGTIYKRNDGRWCAAFYVGNKRKFLYGKSQKEVKEKLKKLIEKLESEGDLISRENMTLASWILDFMEEYKSNELKATTMTTYMTFYRKHIKESNVGKMKLQDIQTVDLQKYYNKKLAEGLSAKTVRHLSVIIRESLTQAVRLKYIKASPQDGVILPKKEKFVGNTLSQADVTKLLSEAESEPLYPLIMTAILSGMRKGELLGLQWQNVDLENGYIKVEKSLCRVANGEDKKGRQRTKVVLLEPKNETSKRTIPISTQLITILKEYKEKQEQYKEGASDFYNNKLNLVFPNYLGNFMSEREVLRSFYSVLDKYGIPYLKDKIPSFIRVYRTPQDFRRFMQSQFEHYKERRSYIYEQMKNAIIFLEEQVDFSANNNINVLTKGIRLGDGGYGEVYLCHHEVLDHDFAIKFFNPIFVSKEEQKEGEKRFFREAKILFELHCDHIVQIYDAGYIDDQPFIRMEYIDGYDINGLLKNYSLIPFEKSLTPILEILHGLKYAHGKGIIHRDLKPSNVMFSMSKKQFKIIDFGISAFIDTENYTKLTRTGEQVAGGAYIDPQLQINPKLRDPRCDLYSVGAIWYYMLTGEVPSGSDMKQRLIARTGLQESQADVITKCLAYKLEDRYSNCDEMIKIISDIKNDEDNSRDAKKHN